MSHGQGRGGGKKHLEVVSEEFTNSVGIAHFL